MEPDKKAKGWVPQLTDFPEFTIFLDELTQFADQVRSLPYGILALIAIALKDIKDGSEDEIDSSDFGLYEKIYYFIAGAMMSTEEKNLIIQEVDIDNLEIIIENMTTKISLLEGYYAGLLDAKFIDNEWLYGMTKDQANNLLKRLRKT